MATARKSTTRRTTARKAPARRPTTRRSSASREPAALKRLNQALDSAQEALKALRKDVGKDVTSGARGVYGDLEKFVKEARRNTGKFTQTLERDIQKLQKRLATTARPTRRSSGTRRKTTARSTAKRSTARRSTAKRSTARRTGSTARRTGSRTTSRARSTSGSRRS